MTANHSRDRRQYRNWLRQQRTARLSNPRPEPVDPRRVASSQSIIRYTFSSERLMPNSSSSRRTLPRLLSGFASRAITVWNSASWEAW